MEFKWASEHMGDEADAGMFAFERADENYTVLVVMNVGDRHAARTSDGGQDMQTTFAQGTQLVDVIGGQTVTVGEAGRVSVEALPHQVMLLVPEDRVVIE